jgi:hypothetical protein
VALSCHPKPEMVGGASDVAACGDLLGGNHSTVGCLRTPRGDSSSVVTIEGSRSLRPPSMCCRTTSVACRCSLGHLRPFRAGRDSNPALNTLSSKHRWTRDAMATLHHTKGLAGRWPTRKPSTTSPIKCTPPVKTPLRLVRRPLATDAYAAPPPRATRVRARRRLCNQQPAD